MTSTPSPAALAHLRKPAPAPQIVADVDGNQPVVVRPGTAVITEVRVHDGVVKAKHLKPGQQVRSWLHNQALGSVKTVESVTRIDDGEFVEVVFSSAHPSVRVKAAHRYFDETLVGSTFERKVRVAAFVDAR